MFNFDFLEKDLGLVSPPNFVYDFSRKIFLKLNSINYPNFIYESSLLLDILGNMFIIVISFFVNDAIKFETILSILIKPSSYT